MKKVLFMALCAAFVAFSCENVIEFQNEDVNSQEQIAPDIKTETHTFSMVFAPSTKLSIANDGKTGWEIGDQIYIHGEYMNTPGYSTIVTLDGVTNTISADKKTAYITVTTTGQEDPVVDGCVKPYERSGWYTTLYAIYPASAAATRSIHCYYYSEVLPSNQPVMVGCNDNTDTFLFMNISSVISFTLPTPVSPSDDYDSIIFSGNNDETVSYDTYALRHAMRNTGSLDDKFGESYESIVFTSGEQKSISTAVNCDGLTPNLICIPGGVNLTKGFTIMFVKDAVITKTLSTSSAIDLAVNDYLPLGDVSPYLKPYVDPRRQITIAPSNYSSTAATSTPGNKMTIDGFDFYSVYARKKSSGTDVALANNSSVSIYNDTSLKKISQIVINKGATTTMYNSFTVYAGTSANPSSTVISGVNTINAGGSGYSKITYDFSSGDYTHFAITYSSEYEGYCGDIEITYLDE